MPTQDKIGENEGIDSGDELLDIVSYEPDEINAESDDEKSDAQLVSEGLIVEDTDDELTITPNSVFDPKQREEAEKKEKEEGEDLDKKNPDKDKAGAEDKDKKDEKDKKSGDEKSPEDIKKEKIEKEKADKIEADGGKVEDKLKKKAPASAPDKVQLRINKITKEKFEQERAKDLLAKENEELKSKLQTLENSTKKTDLKNSKPVLEDFESDAEFYEAMGRWGAKVELHENKITESSVEAEKKIETAKTTESKATEGETPPGEEDPRIELFRRGNELYEDFEEITQNKNLAISQTTGELVMTSEHAAEIFYHLGQDLELAKEINQIKDPTQVAMRIGFIAAQFEVPEVKTQLPGEESELPGEPTKPQKQDTKPSKTLEPVKPLSGKGASSSTDLEGVSIADYNKKRGFTRDGMKIRKVASI